MRKCKLLICVVAIIALMGNAYAGLPVTTGLVMDLDADTIAGLSNGDTVSTWVDQSGTGNDATQSTADNQPTYVMSNADFAGHATVHFDGTDDWMELPSTAINVGSFTMFAVAKYDNLDSNQYIVAGQNGGGNGRIRFQLDTKLDGYDPQFLWRAGSSSWKDIIIDADTEIHVFGETSEVKGYLDGVYIEDSANSSSDTPPAFNIGSYNRGEKDFFTGDLAELVIYNRVLTEPEIIEISDYLSSKWSSFYVNNPLPDNGDTGVALDVTLQWDGTEDAVNPGQLDPNIVKYYVLIDEDNTDPDPNLYYAGEVVVTDWSNLTASYGPLSLDFDQNVSWQIEEALDNGEGGAYATGDPNNLKGGVWSFTTLPSNPTFTTPPVNTYFEEGDADVSLTVEATTGYPPLTYEWYKVGTAEALTDGASYSGTDSAELVVLTPELSDEGEYYCIATGTNDGATQSDTAILKMKRMVAEYKFEQNADDSVGANNGTVYNGPLNYVSDVVSLDGQAYSADPNGGNCVELPLAAYPKTGFGNALEEGTISMWLKLDETMTGAQAALGTFNDSDSTAIMIEAVYNNTIRFYYRPASGTAVDCKAPADILDNQWHYVVCTYDADNGEGSAATVYLDGEPIGSATAGTISFTDLEFPVILMARNNRGSYDENFLGLIDDVRIYNYPLIGTDIAQNYYDVTGTKACILDYANSFDVSGPNDEPDCIVNIYDFAEMAKVWMDSGLYPID